MKLSVLIQCDKALEAIKNLPIGSIPIEQWIQANNAYCGLRIELGKILDAIEAGIEVHK